MAGQASSSNSQSHHIPPSIEAAGKYTLEEHCYGYPETEKSSQLPLYFKTEYPEPYNETTDVITKANRPLTRKEENRYTGVVTNARGEKAEYNVFKVYEKLVSQRLTHPILILRNFELDKACDFKMEALQTELGIDLSGFHMRGEFDAVLAVKGRGMILVEVKGTRSQEQIDKAEFQLQRGKIFFNMIMFHISSSSHIHMPFIKLIVFPEELSPSSGSKSPRGSHILHKDILLNFDEKWNELMSELETLNSHNSFSDAGFKRFVRILTGLWCMERVSKASYTFNKDNASSSFVLQQNDRLVDRAILTSDAKRAKRESDILSPVVAVEPCKLMQLKTDIVYLTPEQKHLYQNVPRTLIRGPAGVGKTLLMNLKIRDILENNTNKKILILAPSPHYRRLERLVYSYGFETIISEIYPPLGNKSSVVVMDLDHFFKVQASSLQSYEVGDYHVFIDDLQRLRFTRGGHVDAVYDDVIAFLERTYALLTANDLIFWCALDEGQSEVVEDFESENILSLFYTNKTTSRQLSIPVYVLNKVLRNSVEISAVVQQVRNMRISASRVSSNVLASFSLGHRIRSGTVTYHKLTSWTGNGWNDWKKHGVAFAVDRTRDELTPMLDGRQHQMKFQDVAVLYQTDIGEVEAITEMLLADFKIVPQTIEQFIASGNDALILDDYTNVVSFECACVVYLCCNSSSCYCPNYNVITRGRTKLIIVDYDRNRPPLFEDNVVLTAWAEKDGKFNQV